MPANGRLDLIRRLKVNYALNSPPITQCYGPRARKLNSLMTADGKRKNDIDLLAQIKKFLIVGYVYIIMGEMYLNSQYNTYNFTVERNLYYVNTVTN